VASLLEVGTGFHPELSGRDNVFLNGAILGMTKAEIRSKFDEIVAFAEIEKFIDTPVKRYSSGMYVRLAFAVAAHLEPEILIVDEVLAVGDASFQKKCLGKMKDVSGKDGRTVLFVSHNMTAVQSLCSRGILMKNGRTEFVGDIQRCVHDYLLAGGQAPAESCWDDMAKAPGNDRVRLKAIRAISKRNDGQDTSLFDMKTPIDIEIDVAVLKKCTFHTTLHFIREDGSTVFTSGGIPPRDAENATLPGDYRLTCHVPPDLLNEGGYSVNLLLFEDGTHIEVALDDVVGFDVKDLVTRPVGAWHGREPGPVRPRLEWSCS
jgi:lipopolysaccharide transport system ATP-binding protein